MRVGAVVAGLLVAEGLMRLGLYVCAREFQPPSSSMGSEVLARLWYAYSGGMYAALEASSRLATYDPHREGVPTGVGDEERARVRFHDLHEQPGNARRQGVRGAEAGLGHAHRGAR